MSNGFQPRSLRMLCAVIAFLLCIGPAVGEGLEDAPLADEARFVTGMCLDAAGNLYVGTEGGGVWRRDAGPMDAKSTWDHLTRESTGGRSDTLDTSLTTGTPEEKALGDDYAYALACDRQGRVWVGHLNHGVSVFNGKTWRNYDQLTGPIGERVHDLALSPVDGDVWIATDAGLSRYDVEGDTWSYLTRTDSLPADRIACLAFAPDGTLYVGTQSDGVGIGSPPGPDDGGRYAQWRTVAAPTGFGDAKRYPVPLTPTGEGLPSNLINDLLVAGDGTVWAATTTGIAWSRDAGRTWAFLRGVDWSRKAALLRDPPRDMPASTEPPYLLAADYVTCLAEGPGSRLYIGYREEGIESVPPAVLRGEGGEGAEGGGEGGEGDEVGATVERSEGYAQVIITTPGGDVIAGWYGDALSLLHEGQAAAPGERRAATPHPPHPPHPSHRKNTPEMVRDLDRRLKFADGAPQAKPGEEAGQPPLAHPLLPDWTTQGTWPDRYGTAMAICAAMAAPSDHASGPRGPFFSYKLRSGEHTKGGDNKIGGDTLRYFVANLNTDDPRVLVNTVNGGRRQASWNDLGHEYPLAFHGPSIYITLNVPPGVWRASLYFFNKDGHDGRNKLRDYVISVREGAGTDDDFEQSTELVRSRVADFRGGVWTRFRVTGGVEGGAEGGGEGGKMRTYTIRIDDHWSHNTLCSGLFLDAITDPEAAAPRGRDFATRTPDGDIRSIDPATLDIRKMQEPIRPWLDLLEQLEETRATFTTSEADRRLAYALVASRLRDELDAPTDTLEGKHHAIQLRRALAQCMVGLNRYAERDRLLKQVEEIWPVARR